MKKKSIALLVMGLLTVGALPASATTASDKPIHQQAVQQSSRQVAVAASAQKAKDIELQQDQNVYWGVENGYDGFDPARIRTANPERKELPVMEGDYSR